MNDIFSENNFKQITESEFFLAGKKLNPIVFSYLYKSGVSKIYNNTQTDIENKIELKKEISEFIGYDVSLEAQERLFTYFAKDVLEEKFSEKNLKFKTFKEQVDKINAMIEPVLNDLGVEYQLHLCGGSIRDFIMNKEIKDLDLLIEFQDDFQLAAQYGRNSTEKADSLKKAIIKFFEQKKEEIKKHNLNIFEGQSREKILHEIIFQTLNNKNAYEIKDFFWETNEKQKSTTNEQKQEKELTEDDSLVYNGLFSVLKTNNEKMTYPMDLLLNGNKFSYINSFDFDLCKCAYTFKSLKENIEPFYLYEGFIRDVIEEKLSLNGQIFHEQKQVDRCLKDHYIRLKNKYSTHNFQLLEKNTNAELIEYINRAQAFCFLSDKLKEKEGMLKSKPKKI